MRTLLSTLWVTTLLLFGYRDGSAATNNIPLSFFVVSEQKLEGGRLIDTPEFPKLGYIPAVPALVLTNLESVVATVWIEGAATIAKGGKETVEPMKKRTEINIRMRAEDAKRYTAITEQAVGKKVLLMLGETPLMAPRVVAPISTQSLLLSFGEKVDAKTIEKELKKLTK